MQQCEQAKARRLYLAETSCILITLMQMHKAVGSSPRPTVDSCCSGIMFDTAMSWQKSSSHGLTCRKTPIRALIECSFKEGQSQVPWFAFACPTDSSLLANYCQDPSGKGRQTVGVSGDVRAFGPLA